MPIEKRVGLDLMDTDSRLLEKRRIIFTRKKREREMREMAGGGLYLLYLMQPNTT